MEFTILHPFKAPDNHLNSIWPHLNADLARSNREYCHNFSMNSVRVVGLCTPAQLGRALTRKLKRPATKHELHCKRTLSVYAKIFFNFLNPHWTLPLDCASPLDSAEGRTTPEIFLILHRTRTLGVFVWPSPPLRGTRKDLQRHWPAYIYPKFLCSCFCDCSPK